MIRLQLLLASCIIAFPQILPAAECDNVLVLQTEVEDISGSRALAAYRLVDEKAFEEIKKKKDKGTSASLAYNAFKADFDQSDTLEELLKRRESRLDSYGYTQNEFQARSTLRQFLDPQQTNAWVHCKTIASKGGSVMLQVIHQTGSAIAMRVTWQPPTGTPSGDLTINLDGASIDNKRSIKVPMVGPRAKPFLIKLDSGKDEALITAEIAGLDDELRLEAFEKQYVRNPETLPLINTSGELARVKDTGEPCTPQPWVPIVADNSLQLGLLGTNTETAPLGALVLIKERVGAGEVFKELPALFINTGMTAILYGGYTEEIYIKVKDIKECTLSYQISQKTDM